MGIPRSLESHLAQRRTAESIAGRRFGRLVVVQRHASTGKNSRWECRCDCGNPTVVFGANLRRGMTSSCGCLEREARATGPNRTHGACGTPTYGVWAGMLSRCNQPKNSAWKYYGGRGIKVCERWSGPMGFANFLADVGERPSSNLSIDRFPDNNGNYEPGNVRWATTQQQAMNKRHSMIRGKPPLKLSPEQIERASEMLCSGVARRLVAESFGVSVNTVTRALQRRQHDRAA